ncbi:MAG: hypothetical protein JO215_09470 [Ktedonobacteraceae bacterium]|nr:hypothetical protein [Ktedonobacteraceae bacterium]
MRKSNQILALGSLLIILLGLVLVGAWLRFGTGQSSSNPLQPTTAASNTCRGGWKQMPMEVSKSVPLTLQGIAAISSQESWAVGDGLIEHWNGTQWRPVLTPEVQHGTWTAITALSAHDIWVIGQTNGKPQALRGNGQTWTPTSLPTLSPGVVTLSAIAAIAPDNAWIVGSSRSGNYPDETYHPLLFHWNGMNWHEVAGPTNSTGSTLQFAGISAASATDIWMVGNSVGARHVSQQLIEHWNGTTWQRVPPPQGPSIYDNVTLNSVAAIAGNDIWAVGSGVIKSDGSVSGVIEHWNGQKWSSIPISGPESASMSSSPSKRSRQAISGLWAASRILILAWMVPICSIGMANNGAW